MSIVDTLLEVRLAEDDDFLKVKETLTRIGVSSRKENKLFQSCHILHKQQRYFLVHFKELFMLDGKTADFSDEDKGRRNTIATLLQDWKLLKIIDEDMASDPVVPIRMIKIITHKDKGNWELIPKYQIGAKKI